MEMQLIRLQHSMPLSSQVQCRSQCDPSNRPIQRWTVVVLEEKLGILGNSKVTWIIEMFLTVGCRQWVIGQLVYLPHCFFCWMIMDGVGWITQCNVKTRVARRDPRWHRGFSDRSHKDASSWESKGKGLALCLKWGYRKIRTSNCFKSLGPIP